MYQVAESLSKPIADAALAAVGCLTSGGKLLACGQGSAGTGMARLLCSALMLGFERDRPPLAAIPLGPGLASALHPTEGSTGAELSLQVRALGQPGDLLVAFSSRDDATMLAVVAEAHAKDMSVILLSGSGASALPGLLSDTDVWIAVPHERPARVRELHLLALHALCEAIDLQLMGEADQA
eukprot:gene53779-71869_t